MNDYYSYTPLTANTVARAADVNTRFNGVVAAFDKLPTASYISEDRATYSVDTGLANAYVATPVVPITAYNAGLRIRLKATNGNTGASTVNVSGLGVKQIVRADGSPLLLGDIVAGQIMDMTYDGTQFRLAMAFSEMSPAGVAAKVAAAGAITVNGNLTSTSLATVGSLKVGGSGGITINTIGNAGANIMGAADYTTVRALMGLGSMALENTASWAPLASPALTGTPTAPTAAPGTNTTQIANTAFVTAAVGAAGGGSAPLNSPAFTGTPTAPTAATATNTTQLATTAYVKANLTSYATLASPALTGTPTAPTAANGTNTTQIATTAFVLANVPSTAGFAPINGPAFTGVPTAPTPATGTNTTQLATTAYVQANLGNYATTATLASYAPIASPSFTGSVTMAAGRSNSTFSAVSPTTGAGGLRVLGNGSGFSNLTFVNSADNAQWGEIRSTATTLTLTATNIALSGTTTAPTPGLDDNSTLVATTAFVDRTRSFRVDSPGAGFTAGIGHRAWLLKMSGNATVPSGVFAPGDVFTVYNDTAGPQTIIQGSGLTMRLIGTATTGSRVIASRGLATVTFVASNECVVSGAIT